MCCTSGHHWGCVVHLVTIGDVLYIWSPLGMCCTSGHHWGCVVHLVTIWDVLYIWSPLGMYI